MRKYNRLMFSLLLWCLTLKGAAQTDSVFVLPDTARAFTIENFYALILQHHPVVKQAALLSDVARQEIRLARGNFDPKLEFEYVTKQYNSTEYYKVLNGSIKFPTVFPVDPVIGIDRNSGTYINPERYIDNEFNYRQLYAGISLPLGRGLITDERRTALNQAKLFTQLAEAEQIKLVNKILLDAAKDYWQWYFAYYNYKVTNRAVVVALDIFERVKSNVVFGEAAIIDSIQAKITWQQRLIEQQEALLDFKNTGIQLSTYLWDSVNNPLQLNTTWAPVLQPDGATANAAVLSQLLEQAKENHPELRKLNVKLQELEFDRKLAAEFLKPRLNFNYYLLNQPFTPEGNTALQVDDNYKFGLDFGFPIFLRKERAKLAQVKLKVSQTTFERSLAEREIINDVQATYNALVNVNLILTQQINMVSNYDRLLRAELLNLENGESDLFKINIQQEKLLQAQSKMIKLMANVEKQKATLYWAAGVRNLGQ
jgi:outer membrane protein TolC